MHMVILQEQEEINLTHNNMKHIIRYDELTCNQQKAYQSFLYLVSLHQEFLNINIPYM